MIWFLPVLVKREKSAILPLVLELISVIDEGWILRTRKCLRATYGLSAVIVPLTFLPPAAIAV